MLLTDKQTKQCYQRHNLFWQGGKYSSSWWMLHKNTGFWLLIMTKPVHVLADIHHSPTLYSQITGNSELSIPCYPPAFSNILLLLCLRSRFRNYVLHTYAEHSTTWCSEHCYFYVHVCLHMWCVNRIQQGNCPSSQFSIRLVLSIILMIV